MLPADLDTYGGTFTDAEPVEDPTTQMAAAYDMKRSNDLAQCTRNVMKVWIRFETRASNGTLTISARSTIWGDTNSYDPTTATRSSSGVYVLTWPASFNDLLATAETVSFTRGHANICSSVDAGHVNVITSGATATVYIFDATGSASNLTAGTLIDVFLY